MRAGRTTIRDHLIGMVFSFFARGSPVILLCVLSLFILTGCDEQIVHDLTEFEANRVMSRFSETELHPKKVQQSDGRWAIAVARDKSVPALSYLESQRILSPKGLGQAGKTKSAIIPSREEQRFAYQRAVAQSIEDTLNTLAGVLEAHVHLNLPDRDPLVGRAQDDVGSGSVLLLVDDLLLLKTEEVSALVSGASGVPASKVTVLTSRAVNGEPLLEEHSPVGSTQAPATIRPDSEPGSLSRLNWQTQFGNSLGSLCSVFATGFIAVFWVKLRQRRMRAPRFAIPKELEDES